MTEELRSKIRANLFPAALAAVEPWDEFPWHLDERTKECDSWKRHSSQAMAIDIFGTLKMTAQGERDAIFNHVASLLGIPGAGPWHVELEWSDPENLMRENPRHRTQVDAVAFGQRSLIFFECKLAERKLSTCSQIIPIRDGPKRGTIQCNGSYDTQLNPLNRVESRCALSGKGIRYWEFIPELFGYDNQQSYAACPFAGSTFQWMRNSTVARLVAQSKGLIPAFVVVYARHIALPISMYMESELWRTFQQGVAISLRPLSVTYQQFVQWTSGASGVHGDVWQALQVWTEQKIAESAAIAAKRATRPSQG